MQNKWLTAIFTTLIMGSRVFAGSNAIDITDFSGSTRAAAMGYTHTAIAQGTDSIFYNPAGSVFFRKGFEMKTNSVKQFGDVQNTQIALGWKPEKLDWVMGAAYYRSELSGIPVTAIQDSQQVQVNSLNTVKQIYTLNLSTFLIPQFLSFGLNAKSYLYDFSLAKATGLGIDAGLLARFESENQNFFAAGLVVHNLNKTAISWSTGHTDTIPRRLSVGVAIGRSMWDRKIILATDYHTTDLFEKFSSVGLEFELFPDFLKARVGSQSNQSGMTLGLGLTYSGASIDFAYLPNTDLGTSMQYSLGLTL
jgi:hypothetical protein